MIEIERQDAYKLMDILNEHTKNFNNDTRGITNNDQKRCDEDLGQKT